jgi:hypothetical protein
MTVTFRALEAPGDVAGFRIVCRCEEPTGPLFADYELALAGWRSAVWPPCGMAECSLDWSNAYPAPEYALEIPEVNVSSANAPVLLRLLGLPVADDGDHYGQVDAVDLAGRAALALALLHLMSPDDDVESPAVAALRAVGARVVEVGRPEGWAQDRLHRIEQLASWSANLGRSVQWA